MKYEEFEQKLKELGFYAGFDNDSKEMYIYTPPRMALAVIDDSVQYDVFFSGKCKFLSPEARKEFFDLALEYASTPVEERREKKYRVVAFRRKCGTPKHITEVVTFYRRDSFNALDWTCILENGDESQKWTMKQIKEYDLESCERVKVED